MMDDKIIENFKLVQKKVENVDISDKINFEIETLINQKFVVNKKKPLFTKFALISAIIIVLLIVFYPFNKNKISTNINKKNIEKITLEYAMVSGKEAKKYYYKSDKINRMIVWVQKKGE